MPHDSHVLYDRAALRALTRLARRQALLSVESASQGNRVAIAAGYIRRLIEASSPAERFSEMRRLPGIIGLAQYQRRNRSCYPINLG